VFRVFIAVSYIIGAALPSHEPHLNRFPKAGAIVLNLRLAARKCYAFSLAAPDPDLIARGRKEAREPATELVVSTAIPKTPEISDWLAIFRRHGSPIQNDPPGLGSRTILLVLIAIFDLFITLSTWISRPIGYFCPALTADGKVDCAPK
jgi:hypothetical protein